MLHLGKIEERPKALTLSPAEFRIVVAKIKSKVHKATDCRFAVDQYMSFGQMPTSWTDKKLGSLVVQLVNPVSGLVVEAYTSIYSFLQINLPSHKVLPGG